MTDAATKQPPVSTPRTHARRERLRLAGWTIPQIELSPTASAALNAMMADTGETKSQLIERAILALPVTTD